MRLIVSPSSRAETRWLRHFGAPLALCRPREVDMRYLVAWMLGVPFSVIVLWYLVGHSACG